jgi:hypothetical protein
MVRRRKSIELILMIIIIDDHVQFIDLVHLIRHQSMIAMANQTHDQ